MRTAQQVASRRTAIVAMCNDRPPRFSRTLVFLAVFDWIVARLHSWNLQWTLLVMAAPVAGLLIAAYLVLGLLPADALIFLVCWPFDDGIFFRI